MAWDFSTEPEFQEQLDWVEQFCREEIERGGGNELGDARPGEYPGMMLLCLVKH